MQLDDKVAVVTGGGSGIGAALCRRFAEERARAVVVVDLDSAAATSVAETCGGAAVVCDVGDEAAIRRLVSDVEAEHGRIDLFCANAGIARGLGLGEGSSGPFAPDADWQASWQVHVMAHVYAARAVLPGMLERGTGYWLATASAAGLLTDVSSHVYSVTKHATVAHAEWLSVTYGDRGLGVSCLCPMGVDTPFLDAAYGPLDGGPHVREGMVGVDVVADAVIAGLDRGDFLILPHPEVRDILGRKADDPDRWLAGMRRFRKRHYPDAP